MICVYIALVQKFNRLQYRNHAPFWLRSTTPLHQCCYKKCLQHVAYLVKSLVSDIIGNWVGVASAARVDKARFFVLQNKECSNAYFVELLLVWKACLFTKKKQSDNI